MLVDTRNGLIRAFKAGFAMLSLKRVPFYNNFSQGSLKYILTYMYHRSKIGIYWRKIRGCLLSVFIL